MNCYAVCLYVTLTFGFFPAPVTWGLMFPRHPPPYTDKDRMRERALLIDEQVNETARKMKRSSLSGWKMSGL